jgi:hypothetical protein
MEVKINKAKYLNSQSQRHQSLEQICGVVAFRFLGQHLWYKSYILLSSFRCFLGHVRTQLAKDRVSVSLEQALEWHCQSYRPNRRTLARKQGIEKLRAIHPWADLQTLEIYLAGFDAGELWASGIYDSHNKSDL